MNLGDLPSPLWVLGTDTGVGKTFVAAAIARAWAQQGPVVYRKPFQTGVQSEEDADADAPVVRGPGIQTETGILLRAPLSPMAAAEAEGRRLDLEAMADWCRRPVLPGTRLLLEAAGGLMVPLAEHRTFLAWATDLRIPAVLVARGGLGTLNHVLLSCEALMIRGWTIPAVILNPGVDGSLDPGVGPSLHQRMGQSLGPVTNQRIEAAQANAEILRRFLPMPVWVLDPHQRTLAQ